MATPFDRFAKDLFQEALAPLGEVQVEFEVSVEPQRIDVLFVPGAGSEAARAALGLVGRMAQGPCLFEFFRRTPDVERVRDCLRKHLNFRHVQRRRATSASAPALWVLSTGRPEGALVAFAAFPLAGWPAGVYAATSDLGLHLVVIAELPRDRSTLLVRLLGAGEVQRRALDDLRALPPTSPERTHAAPLLLRLRSQFLHRGPGARSDDEEEFIVNTQEWFEAYNQKLRFEGQKEGRAEGLRHMFARRLGRTLSEPEIQLLDERIATLGAEAIEDLILDGTTADLARWLADHDPAAR